MFYLSIELYHYYVWKHDMPRTLEKIITAEVSGYTSDLGNATNVFCFHDLNLLLYTVSNIQSKAGVLLKVSNVFRCENLALFTVTSIHSIRKSAQNRSSNKKKKVTECIFMILLSTINLSLKNSHSTWSYSRSSFISNLNYLQGVVQ